jgi:hypothetical protein
MCYAQQGAVSEADRRSAHGGLIADTLNLTSPTARQPIGTILENLAPHRGGGSR